MPDGLKEGYSIEELRTALPEDIFDAVMEELDLDDGDEAEGPVVEDLRLDATRAKSDDGTVKYALDGVEVDE